MDKKCIDAMWEEVEPKKERSCSCPSDEERWKEFVEKYKNSNYIIQSDFGIIDLAHDAMKDVFNGENLSYEEYLEAIFRSRNNQRTSFELCYYSNGCCTFKGQLIKFDRKHGKVLFKRIYISAIFMDGDGYEGKEDHVWMDIKPFENYHEGDCLSFNGEIYRYLKTGNGKQISFGLREVSDILKIEFYELPTDEYMFKQFMDQMTCEVCMFHEHCDMGMCIANSCPKHI